MTTYLDQIFDEVERVHPRYTRPTLTDDDWWWAPIGPVQQCECCGMKVFPLQDVRGNRRWCQVGHIEGSASNLRVRLEFHTSQLCHEHKGARTQFSNTNRKEVHEYERERHAAGNGTADDNVPAMGVR